MNEEDYKGAVYSILPIRVCKLGKKLSKGELLTFISMCTFSNRQGLLFATCESIGARSGQDKNTVANNMDKLKKLGLMRDLEKKFQKGQLSKWKTGRRQVLYLGGGKDEVPNHEELPVVSFNKMDRQHLKEHIEQAEQQVSIKHEPVDMQYLTVLNLAVSSALGQPVRYSSTEYAKYMQGKDFKIKFDNVFPKARSFIQKHKRVPKLHEIMEGL